MFLRRHGRLVHPKQLVRVHQCFCDETRLRMLAVLLHGPLCVCHFQEVLRIPQVKASKHLAYLRERGLVAVDGHKAWRIYRLAEPRPPLLDRMLACLQDCAPDFPMFADDARRLKRVDRDSCFPKP